MSMLNIGTSALITTQSALSTTGHNISNVNTEGYNRQRVEQGTRIPNFDGGQYYGSGVAVDSVARTFNTFLAEQVRTFTSQEQQLDTFSIFASQVDDLLGSPELSLSAGLQGFFDAVQDVADDPTSIPARQVMLTEADTLTNRFNTLDTQLDSYNEQVNLNLDNNVKEVNLLSKGIAELNSVIIEASASATGAPNDLLDQRDQLINELSAYISVSVLEQGNGSQSVFIGTGQALVVGLSAVELNVVASPTDTTRAEVVYGPSSINISAQLTGGSIGGLLAVRQEVIDPARLEIDALAAGMVTTINAQHTTGITLSGNAGGNFFEPTGTPNPDAGNIRIALTDPRDIAVAFPVSTVTGATNTGTAQLEVNAVDGSGVGFNAVNALSLGGLAIAYNNGTGNYDLTYEGGSASIAYDPAVDSGKSFDLSALVFSAPATTAPPLTIKLSGVPVDTDSFTLNNSVDALGNFSAVGDNRNALALAELQVTKTLTALDPVTGLPVAGPPTQSFADSYGILVANVATRTHQADVGQKTQQGLLDQTNLRYESVSGVNLDEEAANLIKYQQAYQAASQIITVSNTVFNSLINSF